MNKRILIVGGVAGGASTAARCRRLDEQAEIIMFERGPVVSFSNCCLPYHISGAMEEDKLILMNPAKFKAWFNIDARTHSNVISVNSEQKYIEVEHTLTGEVTKEHYDALVLSPGSNSIVPSFNGLDEMPHYCLKTVPDVSKIMSFITTNNPKHITVIGGGFIGLEAAENLRERGIDVTLVEGSDQIIPFVDKEMSYIGQAELVKNGVKVILNNRVESFAKGKVLLQTGEEIKTDAVILAIGVTPATGFLKGSGIKLTDKGYIEVDECYQTTAKDVYAAGDAILVPHQITGQHIPLAMAGPANKQGRLIADHINGRTILNKGYIGSGVVKLFNMNIASTGMSEKALKNTKIDYEVVYAAPPSIVGIMPGMSLTYSKLIFEKGTGRVLGAQFASEGAADKRADIVATAIKANMTVEDLADLELCYAPSFGTGKDVVNKVGYVGSNLNEEAFEQVRFSDLYELLAAGEQVIDVREEVEFAAGRLKGTVNIPMSILRQCLGELDKERTVYVHCRTGERSYNMARMLSSHGFDVKNVAGSYEFARIYEEVMQTVDSDRSNILIGAALGCMSDLQQKQSNN